MPKTLGIWEWGCPKRGDAQNAVTAAAAAGAITAGRKFSADSILEIRVSQNLSKLGGGKGP